MTRSTFFKQGLNFKCQGSGRCCTARNGYGYVYFTLEDRRRIARLLGMRTSAFTRKYLDSHDGHYHLKDPHKDCIFLQKKRCTVYEARPTQCRTWPFWPDNLNAKTWRSEIAKFCPGVGKGRRYSAEEIRALSRLTED